MSCDPDCPDCDPKHCDFCRRPPEPGSALCAKHADDQLDYDIQEAQEQEARTRWLEYWKQG